MFMEGPLNGFPVWCVAHLVYFGLPTLCPILVRPFLLPERGFGDLIRRQVGGSRLTCSGDVSRQVCD